NAVLEAETALTQASRRQDHEQKRQEMEKSFAARKPAELYDELGGLIEEVPGLKGAFQLALMRVEEQIAQAGQARARLEELNPPPVKLPAQVRPEEVGTAVKAATALLGVHEKRIKSIGELREAIRELLRRSTEFEADAAVVGEHVFKMQVLARV